MNSLTKKFVFAILALALIASSIGSASAYSYNRQGAVNYAKANWNSWVPGSWYFMTRGVDCTNFVSQSLYNGGGWIQRGTQWTTQYQWYFNGAFPRDYSTSWTSVNEFRDFILTSQRGTEIFPSRSEVWARPTRINTGDVMQIDWTGDGTWDHTMFITGVTGNDVLVTYHNNNQIDYSVSKLMRDYPNNKFRVLVLKDTYNY